MTTLLDTPNSQVPGSHLLRSKLLNLTGFFSSFAGTPPAPAGRVAIAGDLFVATPDQGKMEIPTVDWIRRADYCAFVTTDEIDAGLLIRKEACFRTSGYTTMLLLSVHSRSLYLFFKDEG